jgi:hypothetical protein
VLLSSIIESRFPEELQRRQADEAEILASSVSQTQQTPSSPPVGQLYPLLTSSDKHTALLPHLVVALDIRGSSSAVAALNFARQSGMPEVGVFQTSRASEGSIGVLCDIVHVGEERVVLRARTRMVLQESPRILRSEATEEEQRREYVLMGRLERVRDHEEDANLMRAMVGEILELLNRQLQLIGRAGRAIFEDQFGRVPQSVGGIEDFEKFSFWVCACLDTRGNWPLLLTTRSTLERLRLTRGLMRNAGAHVVLAIATDRSWLRLRSGLAGILGLVVILVALWWHGRSTNRHNEAGNFIFRY